MNRSRRVLISSALVAALAAGGPAAAHHSFAMFDEKVDLKLEATVTEFQWTNPHSWFHVVVQTPTGPKKWAIEGPVIQNLRKMGLTKDSFKVGDKATFLIHPMRNGSPAGSLVSITMPDGKVFQQDTPLTYQKTIPRKRPAG